MSLDRQICGGRTPGYDIRSRELIDNVGILRRVERFLHIAFELSSTGEALDRNHDLHAYDGMEKGAQIYCAVDRGDINVCLHGLGRAREVMEGRRPLEAQLTVRREMKTNSSRRTLRRE